MSMVIWSFLDLHSSYSGWTKPRRSVSVAQARDAREELDPSGPAEQADALGPIAGDGVEESEADKQVVPSD